MVSINFIPRQIRLSQLRRRHAVRWSAALIVSAVLLTVPLVYDWIRRTEAATLQEEVTLRQTELEQIRKELRALTSESSELTLQIERANRLRTKRAWSGLLGSIGECLPGDAWLTSVATDPPSPTDSGKPATPAKRPGEGTSKQLVLDAPRRLKISGTGIDPAGPHVFVNKLKQTGMFASVVLERSARDASPDSPHFQFHVVCEW